jgi:hypothetical protein
MSTVPGSMPSGSLSSEDRFQTAASIIPTGGEVYRAFVYIFLERKKQGDLTYAYLY